MNRIIRVGALVLVVLLVVLTGMMFFSLGNGGNAASIGIIGGADGPTTIFLAGPNSSSLLFILCVITFSLAALLIWYKKPKAEAYQWDEESEGEADDFGDDSID